MRRLRHRLLELLVAGLFEFGGRLPKNIRHLICRLFARTTLLVQPRHRRRIAEHLERSFDEGAPSIRQIADHFGDLAAEVLWLARASAEEVLAEVDFDGIEHFETALAQGKGVVFVSGHVGNWEILNAALCCYGLPMTGVVRSLDDQGVDRRINDMRERFGTRIYHRGPKVGRQMLRALADGRVLGMLIDQDIRDIPGVFVDFFGRPAHTPSGAALLAVRGDRPMVPALIERRENGRHLIRVMPPLEAPPGEVDEQIAELTRMATALIETAVRRNPAQWVWMHRRWRQKPEATGT